MNALLAQSESQTNGDVAISSIAEFLTEAAKFLGIGPDNLLHIIQSVVIFIILMLGRFVVLRLVRRKVEDIRSHYMWRRTINYSTTLLLVLLIFPIWFSAFENIGTFLGLVSAGVAIALGDPLVNLAGWAFLFVRRPYSVGDRIEINGMIGDVIDIRLFQTHLLECGNWVDAEQSTGRTLMIPNGMAFRHAIFNYTHGFSHVWNELGVLVTFESDWRRAREILNAVAAEHAQPLSEGAQEQIRRAARKQMIFFSKLTPIVYLTVKDSGVMLSLRYLTDARQRRGADQRIWEAILIAFEKEDNIDFAYPTMRYYQNQYEGKPPMRAKSE